MKSGIEGRIYCKHNVAATTASVEPSWKWLSGKFARPWNAAELYFFCTRRALRTAHWVQQTVLDLRHALQFAKASSPAPPVAMNSRVLLGIKKLSVCSHDSEEDCKSFFFMREHKLNNKKYKWKPKNTHEREKNRKGWKEEWEKSEEW